MFLMRYVLFVWMSQALTVSAAPHGHDDKYVTVTKFETRTVSAAECSISAGTTTSSSISSSVNTNPTTTLIATATATNYGLNDAAKEAGKLYFGTAADIPGTGEAEDPYYMAEFNNTHDFGGATPANIMKVSLRSLCQAWSRMSNAELTRTWYDSMNSQSQNKASSTIRAPTTSWTSSRPRAKWFAAII